MIALTDAKMAFPIEGDLTHSDAGVCYAQLVERILARKELSRQILVTSAGEQEGKTVTAVNLAFAFHAQRIPVLLAELSFKRPAFSRVFMSSPLSKGIEAVLAEGVSLEATVCVRKDNNLHVAMVNKQQATNELLAPGDRLVKLLLDARTRYGWTLFDGPSADATHITTLAASVGGVLLVARARRTTAADIERALARIAHPNTIVILNDA